MHRKLFKFFLLISLFFPILAIAKVPSWQIIPTESSISFTGKMNNVSTSGKFTKFSGEINFDRDQLKASNVKMVIETSSLTTSYGEIAKTLKNADWFDTKLFPQVVFKASDFTKTSDKTYQAKGTLTIRDKTIPTTLTFTEEEISAKKVKVKGSTQLKRTEFEVGKGEWASTDDVADEVKVDFTIVAISK